MPNESTNDGWTQISSKNRRNKINQTTPHPQPNAKTLNPPSRDLTLPALQRDYTTKLKSWKSSTCRRQLLSILNRGRPDGGWGIQRAICLGSGSFSRENLECRRRSLWQIVVFVDVVGYLREDLGMHVEGSAQEPMYTELDVEFLRGLDIKVLQVDVGTKTERSGPAADLLVPACFVYEPFLDMSAAMLRELSEADLRLYIGSSIRGLRERDTEAGKLAREFAGGRRMYKFPAFEGDPNVVEGLEVFWGEEGEDD